MANQTISGAVRPMHVLATPAAAKARPASRQRGTWFLIALLALFPVVPMPIAGGTPIAVGLMAVMLVTLIATGRPLVVDGSDVAIIVASLLLLFLEGITVLRFDTAEDMNYLLGRAYWVTLLVVTILVVNSEIRSGNLKFLPHALFWGLLVLIVAMAMESAFYPQFDKGRDFQTFALPWPRATGVPNSDGKLGTFLAICLAVFLFWRPNIARWQWLFLGGGAVVGLSFTQSRSTLLAFAVVIGLYWVYRALTEREAGMAFIYWMITIIGAAFGLYIFQDILSTLVGQGIFEKNVYARLHHVEYGLRAASEAPLFGGGADAIKEYDISAGIHNTGLAMAAKSGIAAGVLAILLIIFPLFYFRGSTRVTLAVAALSLCVLTEHMLYPGFVNEFIIISFLVAKCIKVSEMQGNFRAS